MTQLLVLMCALSISATEPAPSMPGELSTASSSQLDELCQSARDNRAACGPSAAWYVLCRLGIKADRKELITSANCGEKGTAIRQVVEILNEHGCQASAIRTSTDRIGLLPSPAVLIVDRGTHCVAYDGIDAETGRVRLFEPTNNSIRLISVADLKRTWAGEAIILSAPRPSMLAFCSISVLIAVAVGSLAVPVVRSLPRATRRRGFTTIELLMCVGIAGILMALVLPAVQSARESSRTAYCRSNLRQLGVALQTYESQARVYPPALVWRPAGEPLGLGIAVPGSIDRVSLGVADKSNPDRLYANWIISLLPYTGDTPVAAAFNGQFPIGDEVNAPACSLELPNFKCPADAANGADNPFMRAGLENAKQSYARGNYAINGGTNRRCLARLSQRKTSCKDGFTVDGSDLRRNTSQVYGNGVAGVNRSMRRADFTTGASQLIFVEEIRAGIHPLDRRGVWALGFAGSSVTVCHGLHGNMGPNRGSDAIQGCTDIAKDVTDLDVQCMSCLKAEDDPRLEISERATARSSHVGGINALMADGAVQFIANAVDIRTWHNLHKRDFQGTISY